MSRFSAATLVFLMAGCSDYTIGGGDDGAAPPGPPEAQPDSFDASTYGTEHWLSFMESLDLSMNGNPELSLSITSRQGTQGSIIVPSTGLEIPFEVDANGAVAVELATHAFYPEGSEVAAGTGVMVTAEHPVGVVAVHDRMYFAEATRVLPVQELGTDYVVVASEDRDQSNPSEFVVVATADGTTVDITPSTQTRGLRPAGTAWSVELDAGEAYQVQADADLSGSRVTADARIAVFAGAAHGEVGCDGGLADSHIFDQNLPTARWGRTYTLAPYEGQGGDRITVVAATDGTTVSVDCEAVGDLDAGEAMTFDLDVAAVLTATHPVGVGQVSRSGSCAASGLGDPSLTVLDAAPLTHEGALIVRALDILEQYEPDPRKEETAPPDLHWVGVSAAAGIEVDIGGSVGLFDFGDSYAEGARSLQPGTMRVQASGPFQAKVYGFGHYDAYTYTGGYDCTDCVPELEVDVCEG